MESLTDISYMVTEKMADFLEKAPGLIAIIVTLIIVAGLIG